MILWMALLLLPGGDTYHVDARKGDDRRTPAEARDAATPWKTIRKAASTMVRGDVCRIRTGTYRETVTPASGGVSFEAAPGEFVLVTGLDPVAGWVPREAGSRIYRVAAGREVRAVFVDGAPMNPARHPNDDADMLNWDDWAETSCRNTSKEGTGKAVVTFAGMDKPADHWVGGFYQGLHGNNFYDMNAGRIVASSGGEITLADLNHPLRCGWKEFEGPGRGYIIRCLNALDAPGEWHWENGVLYLCGPGGGDPGARKVEAQTRLWGFDLSGREGIALRGIHFKAASVLMEGSTGCTVEACTFRYHAPWGSRCYPDGLYYAFGGAEDGTSGIHVGGSGNTVKDTYVGHAWGIGLSVRGDGNVIENCFVEDVGWAGRMYYAPIFLTGRGNTVRNCTLRRCPGGGIMSPQTGSRLVKAPRILNNHISDTGRLLLDGGQSGIYISNHDAPSAERSLEGGVIAWNYIGRIHINKDNRKGMAIYLDDGTDFATIHHNVIDAGGGIRWAIFLHGNQHLQEDISCYHNTCWGYWGEAIVSACWGKGGRRNIVIRNNHAQKGGFGALGVRDPVTADHNRENVPAGEFVDAANSNFQLKQGSASIDAGVAIPGINEGHSGRAPDLGAFEFQGAAPSCGASLAVPSFPPDPQE